MGIGLSDIDKVHGDRTCQSCGAKATQAVEWEDTDFGGRWWEVLCDTCTTRTLDAHKEFAEIQAAQEARERESFVARFGVTPETFCEDCGYRACRCQFDRLTGRGGNVAFTLAG